MDCENAIALAPYYPHHKVALKCAFFGGAVDCDDSTRQIGDSAIGPTRAFNNCGERPLIGPGLDRLRQIDIGIGIR